MAALEEPVPCRPGENRTPTKDFGDPSSTIKLQAYKIVKLALYQA